MATKKPRRIAARAGKNPSGTISTQLRGSKYRAGGAKPRAKAGGIIRKPAPKIRYSKSH